MNNVQVILLDLPPRVHGFCRKNSDNSYSIILNSHDCREKNAETYRHEIQHIEKDDFREAAVGEVENIMHK